MSNNYQMLKKSIAGLSAASIIWAFVLTPSASAQKFKWEFKFNGLKGHSSHYHKTLEESAEQARKNILEKVEKISEKLRKIEGFQQMYVKPFGMESCEYKLSKKTNEGFYSEIECNVRISELGSRF